MSAMDQCLEWSSRSVIVALASTQLPQRINMRRRKRSLHAGSSREPLVVGGPLHKGVGARPAKSSGVQTTHFGKRALQELASTASKGARDGPRPLHKAESTAGCGPVKAFGTQTGRFRPVTRS